jgi:hypothetical protein
MSVTQRFFETLYQGAGDGWVVLSHPDPARLTPQGKPQLRSRWFDLAGCPLHRVAHAAAHLARQHNVYFGVALQHPSCTPHPGQRSKASTAYVVPGLWFDLDLAYGQHAASALPQTDAEGLDFLAVFPVRASLIVHSGGGLYGYWLFTEPFTIASEDDRTAIASLSKRFTATVVARGAAHGWTLDALGDLARVLRPPGTINHKYGKPVTLLYEGGERYTPADFERWIVAPPPPVRRHPALRSLDTQGTLDIVRIAQHYGALLGQKSRAEVMGAHPVHGSSTGCNFSVNLEKGVWHCFRHGTGGGPLELIAVAEGVIACETAGPGGLRGEMFRRVVALANDTFGADIPLGRVPGDWRRRARPWTGALHTISAEETRQWLPH